MAYVKGQPFKPQFTDPATNTLMSNGTVEFYLTGTSTPTPYYTDSSGTEGGTSLTLDSGGKPSTDVFFDTNITYKLVVKNAAGGVVETLEPYSLGIDPSLINNYSPVLQNVQALRMANLSGAVGARTLGYYVAGDGGGATYMISPNQDVDGYGDHLLADGNVALIQTVKGRSLYSAQYGVPNDNTAFPAARLNDIMTSISDAGGGELILEDGDYLIQGEEVVAIPEGVTLKCKASGSATIRSEEGGKTAVHTLVNMRSNTKLLHVNLEGSDYIAQSGGADFVAYNKIGVTTQSGSPESNIEIYDVGFSKFIHSDVFVFDQNKQVDIHGCRSPGQQVGAYAEINSEGLVLDWNAAPNTTKLAGGTQVYCLHNFYNSGSGTGKVDIYNNRINNLNDSFAAPNLASTMNHKIYNNESVKFEEGYYGGTGLDFNGCKNCIGYGNTFEGFSYGAHFHAGAENCKAWGNTGKVATGVMYSGAGKSNRTFGNTWILTPFGSGVKQSSIGRGAGIATRETSRQMSSDDVYTSAVDNALTVQSIVSVAAGASGRVHVEIAGHGLKRRNIVEITGVVGVDCNGLWEIAVVDTNNIELIGSTFSGSYISGGTAVSGTAGVVSLRNQSSSNFRIKTHDMDVQDVAVGVWAVDQVRTAYDSASEFTNCGENARGEGAYTDSYAFVTGLSSSGVRARNFTGRKTIAAATTSTDVTFGRPEPTADYQIFLSNSIEDLGVYWTNKTVNGFTVNHASPSFDRELSWMITR